MNSAWREMWPDCVAGRDFEGFDTGFCSCQYCVSRQKHGLEINNEDVEELLEDHKNELSMEEQMARAQ
jgi:hypothetical protein